MDKRSYQADVMYYENNPEAVAAQRDEPAPFQVTDYQLDLRIFLQLQGTATMTVNRGDLPVYPFTLYHCYQVSKVTNQDGERLDYTQNFDYLEVRPNGAKPITQIKVSYSGWSPTFYSNVQATSLPGYCVYFPRAGYQKIYQAGKTLSGGLKVIGDFKVQALPEPANFQVKVHAAKQFYCNLPGTGKNQFTGVSNGVTLLAGFVEQTEIDGIRVVYPALGIDYAQEQSKQMVQNAIDSGYIPKSAKTVMLNGRKGMYNLDYLNYSDSTTIPQTQPKPEVKPGQPEILGTLECEAVRKTLPEYKLPILDLYAAYLYSDRFDAVVKAEKEETTDERMAAMVEMYDEPGYYLQFEKKCRANSDETVLTKTREYILNDSDTRTPEAFLDSLPDTNPKGKEYPPTMNFASLYLTPEEAAARDVQQNSPATKQGE